MMSLRRHVPGWFQALRRLAADESGQDLVEYALLLGVITVLCVVAIQTIGTQVAEIYNAVVGIVTPLA